MTLEMRATDAPLECRSLDERIIEGRITQWGETAKVTRRDGSSYWERFIRGAFDGVNPEDVVLRNEHANTIGRGITLEDHDDGAYMSFRVANTPAGDEVLTLADEGVLRNFSIGFREPKSRIIQENGRKVIERVKAVLAETSTTWRPVYAGSVITNVRHEEAPDMDTNDYDTELAEAKETISTLEERVNDNDLEIRKLTTSLDDIRIPEPVETRTVADVVEPSEWFAAEVLALGGDDTYRRALDDIVGELVPTGTDTTDASGLVPEEHLGAQLVHVLNQDRPLFAAAGAFPMPKSGYARIPVVTQNTVVSNRAGQKQPVNTGSMVVKPVGYEAEWFDGASDIALELIKISDPGILGMHWEDLMAGYAAATEADAVLRAITAATPSGADLPVDTYGNFIKAVALQSLNIKKATGSHGDTLVVTWTNWIEILGLLDGTGRRVFATRGAQNADAAATITAEEVGLDGGITVKPHRVDTTGVDLMFNSKALRVADGGPMKVEALNVQLMGRDVGLLGRTMVVPRIPAGIINFSSVTAAQKAKKSAKATLAGAEDE